MTNNDKIGYSLSKDYKRLKELVDKGYKVVCFVDFRYNIGNLKRTCRDVCMLNHVCHEEYLDGEEYSFSGRGYCFGNHYPNNPLWNETFDEFCQMLNVEFIDINE